MQHLCEETDPEHLETQTEGTARGGQHAKAHRRDRRGGRDVGFRHGGVTDGERDRSGESARGRDRDVARGHANGGGQTESHRRDPEHAAERVERVEETRALSEARCRQGLAERGKRRAETERRREHRQDHGDRRDPLRRAVRGEQPEDPDRPERARRRAELEEPVARDRPLRASPRECGTEPETPEVTGKHDGGRRRRRAEDERGRPHPEELEAERRGAREGEARPEERGHDARDLARPPRIRLPPPITSSARLASATSAGPSGRSMRYAQ